MSELLLEIVEGEGAGRQIPLTGSVEVGRDTGLAISVSDAQVSRRHARFAADAQGAWVEDLGSSNGTYVNGQIAPGARRLAPGDQVRVGLTVLELRSRSQVAAQPSAVLPAPQIAALAEGVLQPAAASELPPAAPAAQQQPAPGALRAEEQEPAFITPAVHGGQGGGDGGYGSDDIVRFVDTRVKRQTNVAAFALLAIAALAVIIYFGATA